MSRNYLLNPDFSVTQRGTSFTSTTSPANSDDTFLLDRWILLSDGNDIVDVTQQTSSTHLPANCISGISLDVETANKKFGILQVLEQRDSQDLFNKRVCFSFKAKKRSGNATVDKIRAAIITWSSTADTVTSDIVSAWGTEGTNPTLVSNWTYESVPVDLVLTNSFQRFLFSAEIDTASMANVAVFIWCDNSDGTVGDFIDISETQLELGHFPTRFERRPPALEIRACKRYYERITHDGNIPVVAAGWARLTTDAAGVWAFSVEKRVTPTLSKSNDAHIDVMSTNTTFTSSAIAFIFACKTSVVITATTSGLTAGQGIAQRLNTSGAFIDASAEL